MNELSSCTFQCSPVWPQIERFSSRLSHDLILIHSFQHFRDVWGLQLLPAKPSATLNSDLLLQVSVYNKSAKWSEIVTSNAQIESVRSPNRCLFCCRSAESNHRHRAPQRCGACGGVGQLQVQGVQRSPACQTGVETGQQPAAARY